MTKSLHRSFRDNIVILSLVLAIVFAGMNIVLYVLNQSYLETKIESENQAFLELTTHLINENDVSVALEYVEHYTHVHDVEIEVTDENDIMLYSSNISYRYSRQYTIDTNQGTFKIFMDNTTSVTALTVRNNFLYVNVTLLAIYAMSVVLLFVINRISSQKLERDIASVLNLIHNQQRGNELFSYDEFQTIHTRLSDALRQIELLQEQKEMNVKSLAHDIKTPLTILYGFIQTADITQKDQAFQAAQMINRLVEDFLQENDERSHHPLRLDQLILNTLSQYDNVLKTKNLTLETQLGKTTMHWNEQDAVRILENLLSNAYHYSQENTKIHLSLEHNDKTTLILTSVPTNPEAIDVSRIFEKGYSTSLRKSKGLGLYIVKLLLEPINASITAELKQQEFRIIITF